MKIRTHKVNSLVLLTSFLTVSCASVETNNKAMKLLTVGGETEQSEQYPNPDSYETILGFSFDDEEEMLRVRVRSNGCTKKADIDIWQVDKDRLVVNRNRRDSCKAGDSSVVISFTYDELAIKEAGLQHFYIGNAFVSNPNFTRELPLPW